MRKRQTVQSVSLLNQAWVLYLVAMLTSLIGFTAHIVSQYELQASLRVNH